MPSSLIPDDYTVKVDILDGDIFKVGLVLWIAILAWQLSK